MGRGLAGSKDTASGAKEEIISSAKEEKVPRSMTTKKSAKKTTKRAAKKSAAKSAKKSAKKSTSRAAKKATAKTKRTPAKKGKQALFYAEGPACFWVHEGPILTSLVDLEAALREMNEDLYRYHTSGDQNDFAEWVENVLADKSCGAALRKARKPSTAATVVRRHLTVYEY